MNRPRDQRTRNVNIETENRNREEYKIEISAQKKGSTAKEKKSTPVVHMPQVVNIAEPVKRKGKGKTI